MSKKILKNKLKELREKQGILQKDIAETLRISTKTYGQYERCEREISTEILLKLASLFNVPVDEIFFQKLPDRYIELSADERKFFMQYQYLNQEEKKIIHFLVDRLSSENKIICQTYALKTASRDTKKSSDTEYDISQKTMQDFEDADDFSDD